MRTLCKRIKTGRGRSKSRCQPATKQDLEKMEKRIMQTQAQVAAELRDFKGQVVKIKTEVIEKADELRDTIKRLEEIIAAGNTGEASAELVTVKDELKEELQGLDAINPDKTPPPA